MKPLLLLVPLLAVACTAEEPAAPTRGPATPIDPATTGAIRAVVRFVGTPPSETEIRLAGDPTCTAAHPSGRAKSGDVAVRDGRVANAFVYVRKGLERHVFAAPTQPVTIDQRGCLYTPHVLGAETGQEIVFLNSDPTLHNVHVQTENSPAVNFGMAVRGATRSIRIAKSEVMVKLGCDVHPWMRAYIGVLDHPYFAVTATDGSIRLADVPAGAYTLAAWHERFGTRETEISVVAQRTSEATFEYGS